MHNDIPTVTGLVFVTPEMAREWLRRNVNNRALRAKRVEDLARSMSQGEWRYTGEAIKFSRTGRLLDGQHRLAACVRAGVEIPLLVVVGLEDEAQDVMDTGLHRTSGDVLGLHGYKNSTTLAAIVEFAKQVEKNRFGKSGVTRPEVLAFVDGNPEIQECARLAQKYAKLTDLKPSVMGYAIWILSKIDEKAALAFFDDICEMRSTGTGDPIYVLLDRLRKARKARENVSQRTQLAWIYTAWNVRRDGRQIKQMKVRADWDLPVPH